MTNSTPIMESMTVDIWTTQPAGTRCIMHIYDENTTIMSILPGSIARDDTTPLNGIQFLLGDSMPKLVISAAETAHYDIPLWPWKFREGYKYYLYVECGSSCQTNTFYADSPRFTIGERLTENTMMSLINNPTYTIFSFLVAIFLIGLFFKLLKKF
jgi:hypothetical protein